MQRTGRDPLDVLRAWETSGLIRFYQWRAKHLDSETYVARAREFRAAVPGLRLFGNDYASAVIDSSDDGCFSGLHLGQEDLAALSSDERRRLGEKRGRDPDFVLGLSTHNPGQIESAMAELRSASAAWTYLALGPCFPTGSKPTGRDPVLTAVDFSDCLRTMIRELAEGEHPEPYPLVLIGGISALNIEELLVLYAGLPDSSRIQLLVAGIGAFEDIKQISALTEKIQNYSS